MACLKPRIDYRNLVPTLYYTRQCNAIFVVLWENINYSCLERKLKVPPMNLSASAVHASRYSH